MIWSSYRIVSVLIVGEVCYGADWDRRDALQGRDGHNAFAGIGLRNEPKKKVPPCLQIKKEKREGNF